MKLKIDFNGVNFLLTRSKQGNSNAKMPLLTITKGGATTLNNAFAEKFLKPIPKTMYYQIGWEGEDYYLLISKNRQDGFYSFNRATNSTSYYGRSKETIKFLGRKGENVAYKLTPIKVENAKLRGFKLEMIDKGVI